MKKTEAMKIYREGALRRVKLKEGLLWVADFSYSVQVSGMLLFGNVQFIKYKVIQSFRS